MKFVDLFCGLGGGAIGAMRAGLEPIGLFDNLSECGDFLDPRLQPFFVNADLSVLSEDVLGLVTRADVLLCSPPCQSFSSLKSRNRSARPSAIDDAFLQTISLSVDAAMPALVLIENVPAFMRYSSVNSLKTRIERLGYSVEFRVIDAASMGVPQRRKRAIMVASKGQIKLEPVEDVATVRTAFDGLRPLNTSDPLHQSKRNHSKIVQRRIMAIPKDGGSRSALSDDLSLECHRNTNGYRDVYGRMSWDDVAPTITSGCTNPSKGRFIHPIEDRAITLREAARLQTLPDSLTLASVSSNEAKARLIGNAFPPEFAKNVILQNI